MTYASSLNQFAQSNASDFQQSRNDLQPTGSNPQQGGSSIDATGSLSQDQLLGNQLRVGDSTTTVQNTTSAIPSTASVSASSAWVWLIPIIVFFLAIWAVRRQKHASPTVIGEGTTPTKVAESPDLLEAKQKVAKKKSMPASKKTASKRRSRK